MPGNPRYQPPSLIPYFGYDNLAKPLVEVELAVMQTLGNWGIISARDIALLNKEVEEKLFSITMTQIDGVERTITKHDIRALVRLMQERMPEPLRRWVHVPLTSYDVLDTARTLMFRRAHHAVVLPKVKELIRAFCAQALQHVTTTQIGRTHGQHAIPITVGFWFATILSRILENAERMDANLSRVRGKISGPVGAYNAQVGLGIHVSPVNGQTFEDAVLEKLNLQPALISTQILPPEPLAHYLFSCATMVATLGQFGRDCRHLMRTEIGELAEPFAKGQVGSSTMAHKRNPITFEGLEGAWIGVMAEFGKVMSLMVSEHQRDLVGSSVARDLPIFVIKLVNQLDTLLRQNDTGVPFVQRIVVDEAACKRNLEMQWDAVLAEPLYIALQMAGYSGDAHELVNHRVAEHRRKPGPHLLSLVETIDEMANEEKELLSAWESVPQTTKQLLQNPLSYIGDSIGKTREVYDRAMEYLR